MLIFITILLTNIVFLFAEEQVEEKGSPTKNEFSPEQIHIAKGGKFRNCVINLI